VLQLMSVAMCLAVLIVGTSWGSVVAGTTEKEVIETVAL
jgi:hypothetical protein